MYVHTYSEQVAVHISARCFSFLVCCLGSVLDESDLAPGDFHALRAFAYIQTYTFQLEQHQRHSRSPSRRGSDLSTISSQQLPIKMGVGQSHGCMQSIGSRISLNSCFPPQAHPAQCGPPSECRGWDVLGRVAKEMQPRRCSACSGTAARHIQTMSSRLG